MITNIEKEESQLKNELSNKILREEYEPLTERLIKLEEQYKVFTELNQELMDVKETGDIITHEKGARVRTPIKNSINEEDTQRKALGTSINRPDITHATDQSKQNNPAKEECSIIKNSNMHKFYILNLDQSSPASPEEGTINDTSVRKNYALGEVAWMHLFNSYKPELPHTEFMDRLKRL